MRDVLFGQRVPEQTIWNGINETLRTQGRQLTVRVRHETCTGFRPLACAEGGVPAEVAERARLFGPFTPAFQFSDAAFHPSNAALVLSIQADLSVPLLRHRAQEYLLHPYEARFWPQSDQDWLKSEFIREPASSIDQSINELGHVVRRYRSVTKDAPILVFNISSVVPGERIHCYVGAADAMSQRIRKFNCALVDASAELGFSIVDVDRVVAEHGSGQLKLDPTHLNSEGCRLVCEEVVNIFDGLGLLPAARTNAG